MALTSRLSESFFRRDADRVARDLIGMGLFVDGVGGLIVETESYDGSDPASHSFGMKPTLRNQAMFGPPGTAYVYRSYGIHWCLNFVCAPGSAVLIRALAPLRGLARMQARRGTEVERLLCSGPGRLCQALAVSGALNGRNLFAPPFRLQPRAAAVSLQTGPRIGISKAMDAPRRHGLEKSAFLSRPFP